VVPVLAAAAWIEMRRRSKVPVAESTFAILAGGAALVAGLGISLGLGAAPGAAIGLVFTVIASVLLRRAG